MGRPQNVGIKGIELYFPSQCVDQRELENYDGVAEGKYTIGLGQTRMSFCDDREDTNSFALTAVSALIRKYNIDPRSIGRLEVGTETILDKSKSVKSVLMQFFEEYNTDIEGADTYNACYGGTNALFNALNWIESSAWDGRNAIVVAGDIAAYNNQRARPSGGAGCVAMLLGPDAPLVFEPGLRGTYMRHAYDFYKPDPNSEYPYVDGPLSLQCYGEALDGCYKAYLAREAALQAGMAHTNGTRITNGACVTNGKPTTPVINGSRAHVPEPSSPADRFDYMCFHSPTCKTVMKSYARLFYNDFVSDTDNPLFQDVPAGLKTSGDEAARNKVFQLLIKERFAHRVQPGTHVPTQCGNMYTASLYSALCSLLSRVDSKELQGKRIGLFSYGSGLASSMFSLRVIGSTEEIRHKLDLQRRLDERQVVAPASYKEMRGLRDQLYGQKPYTPIGSVDSIGKGVYYLQGIDDMYRRIYAVKQ